jgi:transposase
MRIAGELLKKIAALGLNGHITLVLDNACYQHCAHCISAAKSLDIELLFLLTYFPNLNLIERIWKFVRKKALYGRYFSSFANFRLFIEKCVAELDSIFKDQLDVLMALNFQTFENERTFLSA